MRIETVERERVDDNPSDILQQLKDFKVDSGLDGRYKPNKETYQIKTMNDRHHEIARMHAVGYKNVEIADKLNITPMSVSQVLNSGCVKLKLDTLRGQKDVEAVEAIDQINDMLPAAMKIYENIIDDGTVATDTQMAALQFKAAKEVMGINGHAPITKTFNRTVSTVLTTEDIKELTDDAKKLGIAQSSIPNADFEEVS